MKPEDRKRLKQHIEMVVEHKTPIEELEPELATRYDELLNMRNMEIDQFNDGFNDARAGKPETDYPHYDFDTDNWRLGFAWGMFEPMKEKLARERQVSDALYLLLVDDPNTKLKAEQILIDIYGKCEPSPSDVSMTQDVSIDIKTPSSIKNTNPSILRETDGRKLYPTGDKMSKLKACPFCGEEIYWNEYPDGEIQGHCTTKGCQLFFTDFIGIDINIWNNRPLEDALLARAEAAERRIVKLEIALRKIADQVDRKYGPLPTSGAKRLALEALKEEVEG